jgi:hypothetical protein
MKIIDEKTEKYIKENFNDLDFFFYEEYDLEVKLKNTENGIEELTSTDYMKVMDEDSKSFFIELFTFMPKNHVFVLHIQQPSFHEKDYYPFNNEENKDRIILFEEYDEKDNYVYETSYYMPDFKQSAEVINYDSLFSVVKNLDYSSTRYIGIEYINRKTKEHKYILCHNFSIITDIIAGNRVNENLLQLFKENIGEIFVQYYPKFKDKLESITKKYNEVSDSLIDVVYNEKERQFKNENINRWLENLKSYKGDKEHKEMNCWRSFIKADVPFSSLIQSK